MCIDKTEQFRKKVHDKKGKEFDVLGKYVTAKTKIEMIHKVCGYKWKTTPDNFLRTKFGCPKCSGNAKLTHEDFINKVKMLVGKEYSVLGRYTNARTKIKFIHKVCGYEYSVTPDSFLNQGVRCPKCAGVLKRTDEEFKKLVRSKVGDEYTFLESYKTRDTKLKCVHNTCGYTWKVAPFNFLKNHARCPKCAGNAPLTNEEFLERIYDKFEEEYVFLEEYKNFHTPIKCVHICGYEWKISPANILQGRRCPRCTKESKGEEFIRKTLDKWGIHYETQKKFRGCRYKRHLLFDFYIPNLNLAIEYDGEQHYHPVNFGNRGKKKSNEMFNLIKKRDAIKTSYCSSNNIKLLRIPYYLTNEEVKFLLSKVLNSQEVMQGDSHQNVSS